MKIQKIAILSVIAGLVACASYDEKIMSPWIGASKNELVQKWGYPQSAVDIIRIEKNITVYSYRSYNDIGTGLRPCVVSFTLKDDRVAFYKYQGENCPRIIR